MRIDNKLLALLAVAVFGGGLTACQSEVEEQKTAGTQGQDPTAPMNQAPRQGFTGPATITPPAESTSGEERQEGKQPAEQTGGEAASSPKQSGESGNMGQEKLQQQ